MRPNMQEGLQIVMDRTATIRAFAQQAPGTSEAVAQAKIIARGAQRALSRAPGSHSVRVSNKDGVVTVIVSGAGASRIAPQLARQRDRSIDSVRAAMTAEMSRGTGR